MSEIDRSGNFRGKITDYGLYKSDKSDSVGINVTAKIDEIWDGEGWQDWSSYGIEAKGVFWIIKSNGELNMSQVTALSSIASWDGTIESVTERTWDPQSIQFSVSEEDYNGKKRYRIAFLNEYDRPPGGNSSNVTPEVAKSLKDRFGSQLRAAVAGARRVSPKNSPPSGSRPPVPPPRSLRPPEKPAPVDAIVSNGEHDGTIPF